MVALEALGQECAARHSAGRCRSLAELARHSPLDAHHGPRAGRPAPARLSTRRTPRPPSHSRRATFSVISWTHRRNTWRRGRWTSHCGATRPSLTARPQRWILLS